ncbi:MAG: hypothetical protein U9N73_12620, partial [Candidatus Auribacterota bacterium]|nr:hypothetical protein [Candidatus Auribacterota bacterium]
VCQLYFLMRKGDTGPLIFVTNLFGKFLGYFEISEDTVAEPISPGDAAIFLVNPHNREMQRYDFTEYIAKKQSGEIF